MRKEEFLTNFAYGSLGDDQVIQGFAEHYLCAGLCSRDLCRDVCICISASAAQVAGERLMDIFQQLAGKKKAPTEQQLR